VEWKIRVKLQAQEIAPTEKSYLVDSHGHPGAVHSLRSSIWRNRGEQWQMVFHQGTLISSEQ
jgi:hypothetical protein